MNIEEYALRCDNADDEPSECKVCANNGNDYCFACDNGNQFKPMTNADRIRQMSDEELADFIGTHDCLDCPLNNEDVWCAGTAGLCRGNVLDWLKSRVEVRE